ncbi:flavodoxin family protein [Veillonella criceti]|uniref:flavodoxin family protein n=1 Tax=Veillonella criceti TaxID=103891 RepID=UPI0015836C5D|nr:flavodoxin family protein [Veillonella criceti]
MITFINNYVVTGADTELISLYPLQYRGCVSCFYCKRKDKEHGTCIIRDDLSPVLEKKIKKADAVMLGKTMPSAFIYSMNVTEELSYQFNLRDSLKPFEMFAQTIFAKEPIKYYAYNTFQFDDYSKISHDDT